MRDLKKKRNQISFKLDILKLTNGLPQSVYLLARLTKFSKGGRKSSNEAENTEGIEKILLSK